MSLTHLTQVKIYKDFIVISQSLFTQRGQKNQTRPISVLVYTYSNISSCSGNIVMALSGWSSSGHYNDKKKHTRDNIFFFQVTKYNSFWRRKKENQLNVSVIFQNTVGKTVWSLVYHGQHSWCRSHGTLVGIIKVNQVVYRHCQKSSYDVLSRNRSATYLQGWREEIQVQRK